MATSLALKKVNTGVSLKTNRVNMKRMNRNIDFKAEVIQHMRKLGADEQFIVETVTDSVIKFGIKNNFKAESLAWALMQ